MFSPQEGSLCGELIKMLEDWAPVRVTFIRTPTEEGLPFEMLNTLSIGLAVKKGFQAI